MATKKAAKSPAKKSKAPAAAKKAPAATKKAAAPRAQEAWAFAPLMDLRKRMDEVFEDAMRGWPHFPSLGRDLWDRDILGEPFARLRGEMVDVRFDVSETDKGIEVSAELPGMDEQDVEVTLSEGLLSIKGEKKVQKDEKKKDFHITERRYGSFSRTFRVPDSVDQEKIKASFDKGVLHLSMPKRPELKAKKKTISISKG